MAMDQESPFYRWQQHNLLLSCHLQPNASTDEFIGTHGGRLKIRINAPPIDGKANKQLIKFIAKQFGVTKSAVTITHGELGRKKTLSIEQPDKLPSKLAILRTVS